MTAREIGGELLLRARRKFARAVHRRLSTPEQAVVSDAELQRSLGDLTLAEAATQIRER